MYGHLFYSMTDCWRPVVSKQSLNVRKQMYIHDLNVVGPKSYWETLFFFSCVSEWLLLQYIEI